eukprot:6211134-Pleurochrysis_carterae.AAC.1
MGVSPVQPPRARECVPVGKAATALATAQPVNGARWRARCLLSACGFQISLAATTAIVFFFLLWNVPVVFTQSLVSADSLAVLLEK